MRRIGIIFISMAFFAAALALSGLYIARPVNAGGNVEPIGPLLVRADVMAGMQAARPCLMCHSVEKGGPDKTGPNLWGIVGDNHARSSGYSYSDAMKKLHDRKWTYDALNEFLFDPKAAIPGNKMIFQGIKDANARADLIMWLRALSDNPEPLPK